MEVFGLERLRMDEEYHAGLRELTRESFISRAPQTIARNGSLGNLFAYNHGRLSAGVGEVFGRNGAYAHRTALFEDFAHLQGRETSCFWEHLVRHFGTTLAAAALDSLATPGGCGTLQKAMGAGALALLGLIRN